MQCSSLNDHLFRINIVNSPFCQCGATETTAHFLLHCPRHNATRLRYIHTINLPINLNTDLLLFGSTDSTNTQKTDIFLNVQKVHHKKLTIHLLTIFTQLKHVKKKHLHLYTSFVCFVYFFYLLKLTK